MLSKLKVRHMRRKKQQLKPNSKH